MNKELIKKYKAEFNWWLDGGSVLHKDLNDKTDNDWDEIFTSSHKWERENYTYIINDKYVKFRKALAEGKTVEKCYYSSPDCPMSWEPMKEDFRDMVETYRIKPDEPKFNVGDYVVGSKSIFKLSEAHIENYLDDNKYLYDCKLWTLEEASDDEWVVCDSNGYIIIAHIKDTIIKERTFRWCIPYISQSPKELGL